jgi:hypothetical protein
MKAVIRVQCLSCTPRWHSLRIMLWCTTTSNADFASKKIMMKSCSKSSASRHDSSSMNELFMGAEFCVKPLCILHCHLSHFGLTLFFKIDSTMFSNTGRTVIPR